MISVSALPPRAVFGDRDCGLSRSVASGCRMARAGEGWAITETEESSPTPPLPLGRKEPYRELGISRQDLSGGCGTKYSKARAIAEELWGAQSPGVGVLGRCSQHPDPESQAGLP